MHENAQVVARGFQAFAEGDMDTMRALFSDDMTFHVAGRNWTAGDYSGVGAVIDYLTKVSSAATIENRPHAMLADDEHVVALMESTLSKDGETLENNTVFVFHVDDGKVTEVWLIPMDVYAVDEFWGD